tara:strand:- start:520 stop:1578 length:1059 start_codon:yes stop_codon:yes gene_type:complete
VRKKSWYILRVTGGFSLSLIFLLFLGNLQKNRWLDHKRALPKPILLHFPKATPLNELTKKLRRKRLIGSPGMFELWIKLTGQYSKFQAGNYRFEGSVSVRSLIRDFREGHVYHQPSLVLAVPEGATSSQIADKLGLVRSNLRKGFLRLRHDRVFLRALGVEGTSIEGFLYPATYRFYQKVPPVNVIIQGMVREFRKRLPQGYEQLAKKHGLNLGQAVTFASLIEKETGIDVERSMISEVIWKRLAKKMPLGIDASIIYGIKDYDGDIKTKHLRDITNPYNTRVHLGLPPTPICNPSTKSLNAVFTPSSHDIYYYVLIPNSGGRHHFSKTLAEHNKHVRKLVKSRINQKKDEG